MNGRKWSYWVLARRLKLKDSTISSWLSNWRREQPAKATKVSKPKAKKAKVKTEAKTEPTSKPVNGAGEVTPAN
jgi:hypothetical protein